MTFKTKHDFEYYLDLYKERSLDKNVIVNRFAPSPTGHIHIGSLYSALINIWLSKQTNGVSFLRIEDTDQERLVENGIKGIFDDLNNLNIHFDEDPIKGGDYGPYIQSERRDIYQAFANKLIKDGLAYKCYCNEDEIQEIRNYQESKKLRLGYYGKYAKCRTLKEDLNKDFIIRLKSQGKFENKIILNDLIKGKIEMPENDLDIVLIKKDGLPTYHFAHAVDDYLMGTTHVIRGDEWISSFPVHYELFKLFNFKLPKYAHVSPINIKDNGNIRKISKRKDDWAQVSYYTELGIPYKVVFLYLATLLNSNFEEWYEHNKDLSLNDFKFTFDKMSKSGPIFDMEKLINIARTYFTRMTSDEIYEELLKYSKTYDFDFYNIIKDKKDYTISLLDIERYIKKPRKDISKYSDIKNLFWYMYDEFFYKDESIYDDVEYYDLEILLNYFNNIYDSNDEQKIWWTKLSEYIKNSSFKGYPGDFSKILRVIITKTNISPNLYDLLRILNKDEMIKRVYKYDEEKARD